MEHDTPDQTLPLGVPDGEWALPVLAWTQPDGGDVRRPPSMLLVVEHGAPGTVRLAPPVGWRDLDTWHDVTFVLDGAGLVRVDLTVPGRPHGLGRDTQIPFAMVPDPATGLVADGSGGAAGEFRGRIADDDVVGTWTHDDASGLRIVVEREGGRSLLGWRAQVVDGEVVGVDLAVRHQLRDGTVAGMQVRLG